MHEHTKKNNFLITYVGFKFQLQHPQLVSILTIFFSGSNNIHPGLTLKQQQQQLQPVNFN